MVILTTDPNFLTKKQLSVHLQKIPSPGRQTLVDRIITAVNFEKKKHLHILNRVYNLTSNKIVKIRYTVGGYIQHPPPTKQKHKTHQNIPKIHPWTGLLQHMHTDLMRTARGDITGQQTIVANGGISGLGSRNQG